MIIKSLRLLGLVGLLVCQVTVTQADTTSNAPLFFSKTHDIVEGQNVIQFAAPKNAVGYRYGVARDRNKLKISGIIRSPVAAKAGLDVRVLTLRTIPQIITVGDKMFLIVMTSYASRQSNKGYCGAGTEDYIDLLELSKLKLRFADTLLVQSCLNNIELDGDTEAGKEKASFFRAEENTLYVKWFDNGSGKEEQAKFHILGNKFQKSP